MQPCVHVASSHKQIRVHDAVQPSIGDDIEDGRGRDSFDFAANQQGYWHDREASTPGASTLGDDDYAPAPTRVSTDLSRHSLDLPAGIHSGNVGVDALDLLWGGRGLGSGLAGSAEEIETVSLPDGIPPASCPHTLALSLSLSLSLSHTHTHTHTHTPRLSFAPPSTHHVARMLFMVRANNHDDTKKSILSFVQDHAKDTALLLQFTAVARSVLRQAVEPDLPGRSEECYDYGKATNLPAEGTEYLCLSECPLPPVTAVPAQAI